VAGRACGHGHSCSGFLAHAFMDLDGCFGIKYSRLTYMRYAHRSA
jgi:hypothetical protein